MSRRPSTSGDVLIRLPGKLRPKLLKAAEKDRRSLVRYVQVVVEEALARDLEIHETGKMDWTPEGLREGIRR